MSNKKLNPIVLIIINILAPSMYILLNGVFLQWFLVAFVSFLLIVMARFKRLIVFLLIYAVMHITVNLAMTYHVGEIFALFLTVLMQSVPCFVLVSVLINKYTSAELLSALETMRIPRTLVVAVTITLKYIPTFSREFKYIKESMRLRGIAFTWKHPFKTFQYFIVPQLFRCAALSEEVTAAGLVKGIDSPVKRSSYYEQKMRLSDYLLLALFVFGLVGGFIWYKK